MARKKQHGETPTGKKLKPLRKYRESLLPEKALRRRKPLKHRRYQRYATIRTKRGPAPISSYADLMRSMGF